jgi:hypothetical protein
VQCAPDSNPAVQVDPNVASEGGDGGNSGNGAAGGGGGGRGPGGDGDEEFLNRDQV